MGESAKIMLMHLIKISVQLSIPFATWRIFFPKAMMAKPTNKAMTIIWSMTALVIGYKKFDGKILTIVSIKEDDLPWLNIRLDVSRVGKLPLKSKATIKPIIAAQAVVII